MNKLADDYVLSNGLVNYLYCFRNYLSDKPEIDELISNYPKESQRLSTAPVMATSDIAKKDAALLSHYDGEVVISHTFSCSFLISYGTKLLFDNLLPRF